MQESKPQETRNKLYQEISYCKKKGASENHSSRPNGLAIDLEHPEKNTTACCQVCSIAEDISRVEKGIGVTGIGQSCACQWKVRY